MNPFAGFSNLPQTQQLEIVVLCMFAAVVIVAIVAIANKQAKQASVWAIILAVLVLLAIDLFAGTIPGVGLLLQIGFGVGVLVLGLIGVLLLAVSKGYSVGTFGRTTFEKDGEMSHSNITLVGPPATFNAVASPMNPASFSGKATPMIETNPGHLIGDGQLSGRLMLPKGMAPADAQYLKWAFSHQDQLEESARSYLQQYVQQ